MISRIKCFLHILIGGILATHWACQIFLGAEDASDFLSSLPNSTAIEAKFTYGQVDKQPAWIVIYPCTDIQGLCPPCSLTETEEASQ